MICRAIGISLQHGQVRGHALARLSALYSNRRCKAGLRPEWGDVLRDLDVWTAPADQGLFCGVAFDRGCGHVFGLFDAGHDARWP